MDGALYIDLHFYILPCLCTFWHAISTSLFIVNDFSVFFYVVGGAGDPKKYVKEILCTCTKHCSTTAEELPG